MSTAQELIDSLQETMDSTSSSDYEYARQEQQRADWEEITGQRRRLSWTEDKQGRVSNSQDENTSIASVVRDENNYPILYSCEDEVPLAVPSETVTWFDFEASFDKSMDVAETVRSLEWMFLENIVDAIGLDKCNFSKQTTSLTGVRRRTNQAESSNRRDHNLRRRTSEVPLLEFPSLITSLSSGPSDDFRPTGNCDFQQYDSSTTQCVKIRGKMWVEYRGDDENAIDDFVRAVVQEEMGKDNGVRFSGGYAKGLTYVGDRKEVQIRDTTTERKIKSNGGGMSTGLLAVVASASFLVVLFVGLFARKHKHRKREDQEEKNMALPELVSSMDLETGSSSEEELSGTEEELSRFDKENRGDECTSPASMDEGSNENRLDPSTTNISRQSPIENEANQLENEEQKDSCEHKDEDPETAAASNDNLCLSKNIDADNSSSLALSCMPILPPLPPAMRRGSSQKLKTKRKKKKRKKRKVLERVNSKEHISEMATIQESEDEESEYGSECGSEFSTDDEGRSSRNSSACSSPVRPQLNMSARSSTSSLPQLSPRAKGELLSSLAFVDASFDDTDYDVSSHDCATVNDSIILDLRKELGLEEDEPNTHTGSNTSEKNAEGRPEWYLTDFQKELGQADTSAVTTTEIPIQDQDNGDETTDRRVWYLSADGDDKIAL